MRKTVFRPFWSYDVQKTERWLAEMAEQGWQLASVDLACRLFRFEQSEPVKRIYLIRYLGENLPIDLTAFGWETAFSAGRWLFMKGSVPLDSNIEMTFRNNWLNRHKCVYDIGLVLLIVSIVLFLVVASIDAFMIAMQADAVSIVPMIVLAVLSGLVVLWSLFTTLKLSGSMYRVKKSFELPNYAPAEMVPVYNRFDSAVEEKLLKGKRLRKFRRPYLMNTPDLFEKWLEDQEAIGWNLYLAEKKWNTFYFLIGKPRKVKYSIDFQINTSKLYFEQHQQAGWKLMLSGNQLPTYTTSKYYIWAKEYGSDELVPQFYATVSEANEIKRRVARKNLGWQIATIVMFVIMVLVNLFEIISPYNDDLFSLVCNILIVSMGSFIITLNIIIACKVFSYLSRLKKSVL